MRRMIAAVGIAVVLAGGAVLAEEAPQIPFTCAELNAAQVSCWIIWLHFCSCTWPDGAGDVF